MEIKQPHLERININNKEENLSFIDHQHIKYYLYKILE
jgi:hypothetical protein